jgi:DNA-binding SARP family transcriptional activator
VAEELARRFLEVGDAAGAAWATRQGLAASPYDERLYRLLMLAADQGGQRAGVESTMEELLRRLEAGEVWPDDLHEGTRALYEQLARRG